MNHAVSAALRHNPESPPMRGRGLKPSAPIITVDMAMSPPMRGRGLKRKWPLACGGLSLVAPHAGAWIETDD